MNRARPMAARLINYFVSLQINILYNYSQIVTPAEVYKLNNLCSDYMVHT